MSRNYTTNKGILFKHQSELQKLPVPSLKETCSLYLQTVKPLVTPAAYQKTVQYVTEFQSPQALGPVLQKRLLERSESETKGWLADWWQDYAYMGYRDPVVIYVNYFFAFKDDQSRTNPIKRAASIIQGAMQFRDSVTRYFSLTSGELEPEATKTGKLCSEQYKYLFNSTRIPKIPSDITRVSDPVTNNHIVVLRKNQFYKLDLTHNGTKLSTKEIEKQLEYIYKLAGDEAEAPVGALTTENRDVWTKVREELESLSDRNKATLDVIERAAFAVCLDDSKPITKEEQSIACWHGDGRNRFFDKSMQFIVFDNGKAGFNGEHSMMEATITHRACDYILEGLKKNTINHQSNEIRNLEFPVKLNFDLNAKLYTAITNATTQFDQLAGKHELVVCTYDGYGKSYIKKLGASPDAYAQMAMQLAYYKMYGVSRATYESAGTRQYLNGRTETGRSVSLESVEFCKAMKTPSLTNEQKGMLARKACASQSAYMGLAGKGHGVDRHFLGLKKLLKENEPVPEIFKDKSFSESCHWNLSTSQVTSDHYDGYGWGEVVSDGYGIAYMVKNYSLQFNIVSQKLNGRHMETFLKEALDEMRVCFEASLPPAKPAAKL